MSKKLHFHWISAQKCAQLSRWTKDPSIYESEGTLATSKLKGASIKIFGQSILGHLIVVKLILFLKNAVSRRLGGHACDSDVSTTKRTKQTKVEACVPAELKGKRHRSLGEYVRIPHSTWWMFTMIALSWGEWVVVLFFYVMTWYSWEVLRKVCVFKQIRVKQGKRGRNQNIPLQS